jgi:arylsulfatase A-like enzyme
LNTPKQLEGKSLVPILKDPKKMTKKFAMSQFPRGNKMGYAMRTKRFRYIQWFLWNKKRGVTNYTPIAVELYDYEKDPLEKINKADNIEYKEEVKKLAKMMQDFLRKKNNNTGEPE